MNKTAELVVRWSEYEIYHPEAGIEEFCLHYLTTEREKEQQLKFSGSVVPPELSSILVKMIGRLVKLHSAYALKAIKECGINNFDDFVYLNTISVNNCPKKTQVIYSNFNELSSGLLILSRLKKMELIREQQDEEDKRSKRLFTTEKGEKTLKECYQKMNSINQLFFKEMPEDDIRLCIQLLSRTESKFSEKWMLDKEKSFKNLTT